MGIFQGLSKFVLRLLGWRLTGSNPGQLNKYILAVIPHTSNWDFPLGLLVRSAMGLKAKFIGKSSLFRFPYGWLFRVLGGYPVNRARSQNYVEAVADIFNSKDEFAIAIAPEGTRSPVERLKSGFYYISREAKVPIILVRFDYGTHTVDFSEPLPLNLSYEEVLEEMRVYFSEATGKIPGNAWPGSADQAAGS